MVIMFIMVIMVIVVIVVIMAMAVIVVVVLGVSGMVVAMSAVLSLDTEQSPRAGTHMKLPRDLATSLLRSLLRTQQRGATTQNPQKPTGRNATNFENKLQAFA